MSVRAEREMESDISYTSSAQSGVLDLWTTVSVVFLSGFQEVRVLTLTAAVHNT